VVTVVVDGAGVTVTDLDVLTALSVRLDSVAPSLLDAALGDHGRFDGRHAWLDVAWLEAAGPLDRDWRQGFARMVEYAGSRGWLTDDGLEVRAHLEGTSPG
jgi:hypothetical protein